MRRWLPIVLLAAAVATECASMPAVAADLVRVRQAKLNGAEFAYVEEGTGTPVLFVHGALGDWRTWDGLRPYISSRYRYISLSRRYHYPNVWADDGRLDTDQQHVEDLAAFIRELGLGKVHLIGSSYGGRLAGFLAVKYPELLRSVILGEPGLIRPTSPEGRAAQAAVAKDSELVSLAASRGDYNQAAIYLANLVLGDSNGFVGMPLEWQRRWLENAKALGTPDTAQGSLTVTCDELKRLKVPVLAVRGETTRENFRFGHEALLSCLPPTAESAIIPRARHIWAVDNPQAAAEVMLAFIAKH